MWKEHPVLFSVVIIISIFMATRVINVLIDRHTEEAPAPIAVSQPAEPPAAPPTVKTSKKRNPLVPEDPAKYGMIVSAPEEMPRNQTQWDLYIQKALIDNKVLEQPEAKPALEMMQKTPDQFAEKVAEIDKRIAQYEAQKIQDPSDEDADKHLQNLYMLKSLSKALENKVVVPSP